MVRGRSEKGLGKGFRRGWNHRFPGLKDINLLWPMDYVAKPVTKAGMASSFHFSGQETVALIQSTCLRSYRLEVAKLK